MGVVSPGGQPRGPDAQAFVLQHPAEVAFGLGAQA